MHTPQIIFIVLQALGVLIEMRNSGHRGTMQLIAAGITQGLLIWGGWYR